MPTRPKRVPQPPASSYTPLRILSSTYSPLPASSHTALPNFLFRCITEWSTLYTESEKELLISTFPPAYRLHKTDEDGKLLCPLSIQFVEDDLVLRAGIERFKRDIKDGYYDLTWRKEAAKAVAERVAGKFDGYLLEKVEEEFGEVKAEEGQTSESDKEWGRGNHNIKAKRGVAWKVQQRENGGQRSARGELSGLATEMDGTNDYDDIEKMDIMERAMAP